MMMTSIRKWASAICAAALPWVAASTPATAALFVESQLSGERSESEIRSRMLRDGIRSQLTARGLTDEQAAWWVDRSMETESLSAWMRGDVVQPEALGREIWTVWRSAGPERHQVFARVVGVNVPGLLLLLLPLAVAGAVLAASGGSAGAIVGGALLVGLIFVLLANPRFLFGGERE